MKQFNDPTRELAKWLGGAAAGAAAGAALMYMLDPDRGSARRAQSGEKLRGLSRQTGNALGNAARSLGGRAGSDMGGADWDSATDKTAGAAGRLADQTVQDVAQSASQLAQDARQGASQLASGAQQMMQTTAERLRGDWTPGTRNAAMLGGGLLGVVGLMRRSPLGMALGMAGLTLLARGATNLSLKTMVSGKALAQPIDLEKTIRIDASPEQVYDAWTNLENFPQFMPHVVEVRDLGARRSHWVVRGPAGTRFEWDAVTTEQSRPNRLAWRTEPGAEIAQSGSIQFEPDRDGTRVTVRMTYTPPAGVVGHGIAKLLGADPNRQMDDDLARMKDFIEHGAIPQEGARGMASSGRSLH